MNKIVSLKKYNHLNPFWSYLIQHNNLNLSVEEVIKAYKGFEAESIQFYSLADYKNLPWTGLKNDLLFLYLSTEPSPIPFQIKSEFYHLGYDFGICEVDWTVYSSIFNEVLFGNIQDLISYKDQLNENLLFKDRATAESYREFHHILYNNHIDVEHDEAMCIYEVWGRTP
ncbi:MAG: hypothetical protein BGO14_01155 [Chlamydiales bacterium 38-26]|nr:hypothetical protein [Chlamydiales bacterium]OJV07328.1 MAG: hypothetical protein BGO14_01155 [Chlamydiales bacterium 38-26]